jgi:putative addiction module killer protein
MITYFLGDLLNLLIKEYVSLGGKNYFRLWLDDLEKSSRSKIQARLFRVELGNLGNYKKLGDGVSELKIEFGPGFRVYFGEEDGQIILLLIGGDKSSQKKDIQKAKALWAENLGRKNHGKKNS